MSVLKTRPDVSQDEGEIDPHAPRPLSFTENVVLTLKLLGGLGLLGAALWAGSLLTAAK